MITLTIRNLKSKKDTIEIFDSKDKAEARIQKLETSIERVNDGSTKKKEYLVAYSYDTESEKSLIEQYLPDDRKVNGGK